MPWQWVFAVARCVSLLSRKFQLGVGKVQHFLTGVQPAWEEGRRKEGKEGRKKRRRKKGEEGKKKLGPVHEGQYFLRQKLNTKYGSKTYQRFSFCHLSLLSRGS